MEHYDLKILNTWEEAFWNDMKNISKEKMSWNQIKVFKKIQTKLKNTGII